ncbi:MAG: beta-ketoacyl-ACP synthase [SAR324 cluster bacterium]|nr:beta-ketoacyl-ACP synthase [SAR324 cluster bacterium]
MTRRVVVTGMAGLSPIGMEWPTVLAALKAGKSAVQVMADWQTVEGLRTHLGAPITDFVVPDHYTRKEIRSMGRVSLLATRASELALEDAGLLNQPEQTDGRMGAAFGSGTGSPPASQVFFNSLHVNQQLKGISATTYIKMMSNTCVANLGQFFKLKGRLIPTCSACTSGSQALGFAYEAVKYGQQDFMLAGGAEELSVSEAAMFDVLYATSTRNDTPSQTPAPFDHNRDGLVIGEGAASFVLETLDSATARGATVHAELVGHGANSDGEHMTAPAVSGMQRVMELALEDAGLAPQAIGYVNAHGTATEVGDIAESEATQRVFGESLPISSLKGHIGHTMGACGALETWMTLHMAREGWFAPTRNLREVDSRCAPLDYLMGTGRKLDVEHVMCNNFAFGGINTSLIFQKK